MPSMTFRFTTECEITFEGSSYEEAYLQFKDLCHQQQALTHHPRLKVYPPESSNIYFEVDEQNDFNQMAMMKGDFKQDILDNLPPNWVKRIHAPPMH